MAQAGIHAYPAAGAPGWSWVKRRQSVLSHPRTSDISAANRREAARACGIPRAEVLFCAADSDGRAHGPDDCGPAKDEAFGKAAAPFPVALPRRTLGGPADWLHRWQPMLNEVRLELTRAQVLTFRRQVGALEKRLPQGESALRHAAWAGLQDSMPRAALLSIHARVEKTEPSTWQDPSLVQIWGPRFNVFVVARRDLAAFSLGTLPDDAKGRARAQDLADRLETVLAGGRMLDGDAGRALGVHPNRLRYAAATGPDQVGWCPAADHLDGAGPRDGRSRGSPRTRSPIPAHLWAHNAGGIRSVGGNRPSPRRRGVLFAARIAHAGADTDRRRMDP